MAAFDVLLPVKNGSPYLAASLDSIVTQSFQDWRLLVLDHGSTDGSLELAHRYAERDARVQVRPFPQAQGLSGLLNCGLDLCDGRYVLRQDADDISLPDRMQVLHQMFESRPDLVLCGSQGDVIDAKGRTTGRFDMQIGEGGVRAGALFRIPVAHPTAAMRLDAMHRLGAKYGVDFIGVVAPERRMTVPGLAEDYFLFGQLALVAECMNSDRRLIQYRWHGANVAATKYLAQTQVALNISRYLAESLCLLRGEAVFDPAPFCNHALHLFDMDGRLDFADEFSAMATCLGRVLPESAALRRELAFREVLSDRRRLAMGLCFAKFTARHGHRRSEFDTVKSWMVRTLRRNGTLTLSLGGLSE